MAPIVGASVVYDQPSGITTSPADDRGWQYTGSWGVGGGVTVTPDYFLTAQHLGGGVGSIFNFDGTSYSAVAIHDISGTDLRLVQVSGTFPVYAPVYHGTPGSEVGQSVALVGYGHYSQGAPLITNGVQNGWYWGDATAKNFAMNVVKQAVTIDMAQHLDYTFDPISGAQEGIYTGGDSGGGMFLYSNGRWQVAGIAHSITGFYLHSGDANYVTAAVYDSTGLYVQDQNGNYSLASGPQHGYATEVAAYFPQIDQVLLPGDLNYDGSVGFDDLVVLARNYGKTGASYEQGDFNGDGSVGFDDLVTLARNYGRNLDGSPLPAAGAFIPQDTTSGTVLAPEPGALAILSLSAAAVLLRRRRTA